MKENKRGVVTPNIKELFEYFKVSYDVEFEDKKFLRFMPYLDYLAKNSQTIDPRKIDSEERKILSDLKKLGVIDGGASSPIAFEYEFYIWLQQLLFKAYVLELESVEDVL